MYELVSLGTNSAHKIVNNRSLYKMLMNSWDIFGGLILDTETNTIRQNVFI